MCEFRSLSRQIFEANFSIFSQCLEPYFFKTNEENSQDFQDLNEKETITLVAVCEILWCSVQTIIQPSMYRLLVNNCTQVDALLLYKIRCY